MLTPSPGFRERLLYPLPFLKWGCWLFGIAYFLVNHFYGIGPFVTSYEYNIGLIRSWSDACLVVWMSLPFLISMKFSRRKRLYTFLCVAVFAIFTKSYQDEERQLRKLFKQSARILVYKSIYMDQDGSGRRFIQTAEIVDRDQLYRLGNSLRLDRDPPHHITHYMCTHGEHILYLLDEQGKLLARIEDINRGEGLRWREGANADLRTNIEFQLDWAEAFLAGLPQDAGLSEAESFSRQITHEFSYCKLPAAVEILAAKIPHVDAEHRKIITWALSDMPPNAIPVLMTLTKDEDSEVRSAAYWALEDYALRYPNDPSRVLQFLNAADPSQEANEDVRRAMEDAKKLDNGIYTGNWWHRRYQNCVKLN